MGKLTNARRAWRLRGEQTRRDIYESMFMHITLQGSVSQSQIAKDVGRVKSVVKVHIQHMVKIGWIKHKPGGVRAYELTNRVRMDTINGKPVIVEILP